MSHETRLARDDKEAGDWRFRRRRVSVGVGFAHDTRAGTSSRKVTTGASNATIRLFCFVSAGGLSRIERSSATRQTVRYEPAAPAHPPQGILHVFYQPALATWRLIGHRDGPRRG